MVLAPVVRDRKGEFVELFADMQAQGYVRFRIGRTARRASSRPRLPKLKKTEKHDIDVVIDRLRVRPDVQQRLAESFEAALRIADGRAIALEMDSAAPAREHLFSTKFACPVCSYSLQRAGAAAVLLQLAGRRLPGLRRPGPGGGVRPGARGGLSVPEPGQRRGQGLGPAQCLQLLDAAKAWPGTTASTSTRPSRSCPRRRAGAAARLGRGGHRVRLHQESGSSAGAHGDKRAPLRRHPAQPGAALPRDRFGRGARGPGALPAAALPRLRRLAAAARGAPRLPAAKADQAASRSTESSTRRWPSAWPTSKACSCRAPRPRSPTRSCARSARG